MQTKKKVILIKNMEIIITQARTVISKQTYRGPGERDY